MDSRRLQGQRFYNVSIDAQEVELRSRLPTNMFVVNCTSLALVTRSLWTLSDLLARHSVSVWIMGTSV